MNKSQATQKIQVNNGQELIDKAKEYKNSGGEWKLRERYIEMPWNSSKFGGKRKNKLGWGIIISNGKQTIDIFSPEHNIDYKDFVEKDLLSFDEINVRPELWQLFPEVKFAYINYGNKKLSSSTYKELKKGDNEYYNLYRYLVAESGWHLSQIVHQWVQENKTAIQQSPNSDFASWVEIVDGQDGNMYLYVGKKNDNGGREIKIGIKKDKYFEEVEGIEGNRKRGGEGFYNAGEQLEISWDLMLITVDFSGWPLKFKEKKNKNQQPVPQAIKEKILRNLDKVCLDPMGEIANAEALKSDEIWDLYKIENLHESGLWEKELATKAYRVEIEGEEIDLTQFVNGHWEDYNEIKNALIREIKQNPSEWKIEQRATDSQTILKHKSGRRHWGHDFKYFREELEKTKRDWAEIEALVKGQPLPVEKISDTEKSQILQYFIAKNISKISLENDKLVIEYNNNTKKTIENEDQELQKYHQIIQNIPNKYLSLSELQNNNNSSTSNQNNTGIYIGLTVGAFILGGIFVYFLIHKKKK